MNAVECAVAVQKTIAVRNADVSVRRMQFPIGVNLGDVIHDNAREYGDGVISLSAQACVITAMPMDDQLELIANELPSPLC